ncbi:MAG: hypothetical protein DPW14_10790 [Planctomycetes bacterium]|nr:hypothetical protein [Planctomycetota bacterium]
MSSEARQRISAAGAAASGNAKLYANTKHVREAMASLLGATGVRALVDIAKSILYCGAYAAGIVVKGKQVKVCNRRCKKTRFCAACHGVLAAEIKRRLREILDRERAQGARLAFLTITLKHSLADSLRSLRRDLRRAWALLVRRKFWRCSMIAWHRATEIERTLASGWHPHFHFIVKLDPKSEAYTLSRAQLENALREVWLSITTKLGRPSFVVRVKFIDPDEPSADVVNELVKYITKRSGKETKDGKLGILEYSKAMLVEYASAVKSWHLQQPGGAWMPEKLIDDPDALDEPLAGDEEFVPWERVEFIMALACSDSMDAMEAQKWMAIFPQLVDRFEAAGCPVNAELVRQQLPRVMAGLQRHAVSAVAVKT